MARATTTTEPERPALAVAGPELRSDDLAAVFAHISDSVIVTDAKGTVLQWNSGAERIFGWRADEMIGQNVSRLTDDSVDVGGVFRALERDAPPAGTEWRAHHKDGHDVWVHVHTTPIRDAAGKPVAWVGVAKDITERVAQTDLLVQRLELERHLIGVVSHDLRNPLNAVVLSVALLERLDLPEKARRGVERISRATHRSLRLIDNLMDFTRARRGDRMHITTSRGDLAPLVTTIVEEARLQHPDRAVELDVAAAVCDFDEVRMGQVIQNLVNNSLQHTTAPTPVRVRLFVDDAGVHFDVWNGGPAIAADVLPRLFAPYEQGNSYAADRSLGLGLFIAREAVLAHNGSIDVTSSEEGGTRFAVRLPPVLSSDREGSGS